MQAVQIHKHEGLEIHQYEWVPDPKPIEQERV